MNTAQLAAKFRAFTKKQSSMILKKNADYAQQDKDALSNFKLAGDIAGLSAKLNVLSLIGTKVARLGVLLHDKAPKNESIEDSVLDLGNYTFLLQAILTEQTELLPTIYNGAQEIEEERDRQIEKGFRIHHDMQYVNGELSQAAIYMLTGNKADYPKGWNKKWRLKCEAIECPIKRARIAGAFCAAEIDRLRFVQS